MSSPVNYFANLGFFPGQIEFGTGLANQRLLWSISAYTLLMLGLWAQQCVNLTARPIGFLATGFRWSVFAASAVVAVALFPPLMNWFNKKKRKPSWEHILWAFSFGFFVNLSGNIIWKQLIK